MWQGPVFWVMVSIPPWVLSPLMLDTCLQGVKTAASTTTLNVLSWAQ